MVHAHSSDGARAAVLAGCTAIEHGTFLDDATLELMAQRGVYFDPNFLVLHNYLDNKPKFLGIGNYTEEGFAAMEKGLPLVAEVLKRARTHHVKIVLGTDAVAGAHGRNAEEFIYRVKDGGDKPMDAITSGMTWPRSRWAWRDRDRHDRRRDAGGPGGGGGRSAGGYRGGAARHLRDEGRGGSSVSAVGGRNVSKVERDRPEASCFQLAASRTISWRSVPERRLAIDIRSSLPCRRSSPSLRKIGTPYTAIPFSRR